MSKEDLENSAWEVISSVVDTFCHIIRQTNLRVKNRILWNEAVYGLSDAKRKRYVRLLWEKKKIVRIIGFLQNESCMPAILRNVCIFVMKQIFAGFA